MLEDGERGNKKYSLANSETSTEGCVEIMCLFRSCFFEKYEVF